jgi:hypothetical protein
MSTHNTKGANMFFNKPENDHDYQNRKRKLNADYSLILKDFYARLDSHVKFAKEAIWLATVTFGVAGLVYIPQLIILIADSIITGCRLAINRLEDWDISQPEKPEQSHVPIL